ncbi:MAG TPA: formate dehydrogenase, partial [Halieaceae bacterium]|nr:formate dehydrogenase [Halieaceae bacterium]
MSSRIYLPRDTTAVALGADEVAVALLEQTGEQAGKHSLAIELVRNGSRGMFHLEPLLEVEHQGRRIAFGPVCAGDIPGLLDALAGDAAGHPLYLGVTEDIPWLKGQQRLTFARAGLGDPLCLDHYR